MPYALCSMLYANFKLPFDEIVLDFWGYIDNDDELLPERAIYI
jgi:hypothetical protein